MALEVTGLLQGIKDMSYCVTLNMELEGIDEKKVIDTMFELGWDGSIIDNIGGTIYFQAEGNICMGTTEIGQEQMIREAFEKMNPEAEISITME